MKQILMYLFALTLISANDPTPGYTITRTTPGLKDGTLIVISEGSIETRFDSCIVKNGKFFMRGRIKPVAVPVILQVAGTPNYRGFWMQNSDIVLTCKDSVLKEATITGSPMDAAAREFQAIPNGNRQLRQDWIKQHPDSYMAAYYLRVYGDKWDKEIVKALYEQLSATVQQSSFGLAVKQYLEIGGKVLAGDQYLDFAQPDAKGVVKKFSALRGKYTLLEFWASQCHACRLTNPKVIKLYEQYKSKGFTVVGISLDTKKEAWLNALAADKLPWENLCDLGGVNNAAVMMYGVRDMPTSFLIDEKGVVIARDLRVEALEQKLRELLP